MHSAETGLAGVAGVLDSAAALPDHADATWTSDQSQRSAAAPVVFPLLLSW
jgi:hypothetical protein